jgi:AcrR family transcriptional regulator
MDSSIGQPGRSRPPSDTRRRLLTAGADLIAEVGWGRVTTRAVAERAGLPHGTVSYHFDGKQALLREAAVTAVEAMFPEDQLSSMNSIRRLFETPDAAAHGGRVESELLLEAMRESSRDPVLRGRIAAVLRRLRERVAELLAASDGGPGASAVPPAALAALVVAAGDGLWLHRLLDPELDVAAVQAAIRTLLLGAADEAPA